MEPIDAEPAWEDCPEQARVECAARCGRYLAAGSDFGPEHAKTMLAEMLRDAGWTRGMAGYVCPDCQLLGGPCRARVPEC